MSLCDAVPLTAHDGDVFTCSTCGETATFVVLDDGRPGEWVWQRPTTPNTDLCTVPACRGAVRTLTRVLEDGDPEPYGFCTTCGHLVTN